MLVRVAGDDATAAGGVCPDEQRSAGAREGKLHRCRFGVQRRVGRARAARDARMQLLELRLQLWLEDIESWRNWTSRHEGLEDRQRRCERHVSPNEIGDQ